MTQTTRVEERQNRFLQYVKRRAFLGELLTFFVALLLGRICIAGDIAPFGLAFLAAASISGCNAHYALAGAVFGEILLQAEPQYPAVCACVLYYVMHLLWNCWSRKNRWCNGCWKLIKTNVSKRRITLYWCNNIK